MPQPDRPRVLLHAFSTFKAGGPQVRFVQLANAFGPAYRHLIMAMDGCYEAAERLSDAVVWEKLSLPNLRGGAMANRSAYRRVLQDIRPDLLLTYNWGAIEWLAANLPHSVAAVHVEDGFRPDEVVRQLPRRLWARRLLFAAARAKVLVPSRTLHQVAQGWWVPPSRLAFVPNGVPCSGDDVLQRPTARAEGPVVIGTVAALRAEKNIGRLLRAVAALRAQYDLRLMVVGDGPERPALEKLCGELGLADVTVFTGYTPNPQSALVQMDLFALSSDTEQLPIAMLEAMAHGVPVVATGVGDVPHLLADAGSGPFSAVDDAAFLATLRQALADRAAWSTWAATGLNTVRHHYGMNQMVDRWRAVFDGQWRPLVHG